MPFPLVDAFLMVQDPDAGNRLRISFAEFLILLSLMTAIIALSVDAVLPALDLIGNEFNTATREDTQLIISFLFLGMALSQLFYGPISDAYGRKVVILAGLGLFIVGSLLSIYAESYAVMLTGRVLQGAGVAAPRILSMAIVRDLFVGREMARVMSYSMSIFIIFPVIAPALGQFVLLFSDWRMIITLIMFLSILLGIWIAFRLQETLAPEHRIPLTPVSLKKAAIVVVTHRIAMLYTTISGIVFSVFLAYLSSAQQLYQQVYDTGQWFPLVFASLAIVMGTANIYNGKVVVRLGMRFLVRRSLWGMMLVSLVFIPVIWMYDGVPPLWLLLVFLGLALFCVAMVFGNINALSMEPLGEVAGIGAGIVGSISTFIGLPLGIWIGRYVNTSVWPFVLGFLACSIVCLLLMRLDTSEQ